MSKKVISRQYLPTEPPILFIWLLGLTLAQLDVSPVWWGVYAGVCSVLLLGGFLVVNNEIGVHPKDIK